MLLHLSVLIDGDLRGARNRRRPISEKIVMNMNMEEMKEIERVEGEDMEEARDEPEDIKRIAPWTKQITARGITYEQVGVDTEGNTPGSTKEPGIGWMTGFLFVSSFVGLLALVPLRKFPALGLKAWRNSFYFDFSMTYIGAGMICSHLVNLSLLLGAVLSWGLMWPLIGGRKGEWFPSNLPESSMKSLNGYKVFISIALILGDGLYNFLKILYFTARSMQARAKANRLKTEDKKQNQTSIPCSIVKVSNFNRRKGADLIAKLLCRVTIIL
ncbi:hypothetical protein OIU78_017074 [Salix suchowensis]|nr:hypothetical protein OIU78_017074 [Salix suchowensis]